MTTPHRHRRALSLVGALALAGVVLASTACGDDDDSAETGAGDEAPASSTASTAPPVIDPGDGGDYHPDISADDFVETVDNPFMPLAPGSRWVYEGEEDGETERTEVVVTPDRREVMGVSAVIVRDTVSVGGEVIEDTYDWFAQDRDGNVWYLGEDSTEYEDGEPVSTEGSWEAGVDGALPGIVMPADPQVGDAYRQEYYPGEAEDLAEVVRVDDSARVPYGEFQGVLTIREWNPLEPETVEEKSFAEGVGLVLEVKTAGGEGRSELIEHEAGG